MVQFDLEGRSGIQLKKHANGLRHERNKLNER